MILGDNTMRYVICTKQDGNYLGPTRIVPVEKREKTTLLDIIKERILPGTTVMSDCWKSYDCLTDEGFHHLRVNHSIHFVDPTTGKLFDSYFLT